LLRAGQVAEVAQNQADVSRPPQSPRAESHRAQRTRAG
jgi:hypothetical protein